MAVSTCLSAIQKGEFLPEEVQFLAEDTSVTIVPKLYLLGGHNGKTSFFTGSYGPFRPNSEIDVPLWLALALHKKRRCDIKAPAWLQTDQLKAVLEKERSSSGSFEPLPFHYIEIAALLLRDAKQSFSDWYQIKQLVETIRKVRMTKIIQGLETLSGAMTIELGHLSAMECNIIRPFFLGSLDFFRALQKMKETAEEPSETQQEAPSGGLRQLRR